MDSILSHKNKTPALLSYVFPLVGKAVSTTHTIRDSNGRLLNICEKRGQLDIATKGTK